MLSPNAAKDHWDVVEGQGSIFHPSYAVSLWGSYTAVNQTSLLCVTKRDVTAWQAWSISRPPAFGSDRINLDTGRRTNPSVRCAGVSLKHLKARGGASTRDACRERENFAFPWQIPFGEDRS